MKIKLDENIPLRVQTLLQQLGYDTDTIIQENLTGSTDEQVWQAAQQSGRFLITQNWIFPISAALRPGPILACWSCAWGMVGEKRSINVCGRFLHWKP
jgi:predicted nuclease of predicted toxin-antitoxin system